MFFQRYFILSLSIALLISFKVRAQQFIFKPDLPYDEEAPISDVYIPSGFDDDDFPQVIASGEFPNGCYEVVGPQLTKHTQKHGDFEKIWFSFFISVRRLVGPDCTEKKKAEKNVVFVEVIPLPLLK